MTQQDVLIRIHGKKPFTFDELEDIISSRLLPLQWQWQVRLLVYELLFSHQDFSRNIFYIQTPVRFSSLWILGPRDPGMCGMFGNAEQHEWDMIQWQFERGIKGAFIDLYQKSVGKAFSEVNIFIERTE